ncbi:hypothetical protein AOLI_G00114750 [Acnodon oligacanthus]
MLTLEREAHIQESVLLSSLATAALNQEEWSRQLRLSSVTVLSWAGEDCARPLMGSVGVPLRSHVHGLYGLRVV